MNSFLPSDRAVSVLTTSLERTDNLFVPSMKLAAICRWQHVFEVIFEAFSIKPASMLQFHKYWFNIIDVLRFFPCKTRVKWTQNSEPTQWENSLFIPVQNYLETGKLGPVPMREVEWVEVDPIEIHHIGRMVADRQVDHLENLVHTLSQRGIAFQQVEQYLRFAPHVSQHTSCTEQTGDRSY